MSGDVLRPGDDLGLSPENWNPAEMGWDSFAELLLDVSGFVPKPRALPLPPDANDDEEESYRHLDIKALEEATVNTLEFQGLDHLVAGYKQQVQDYRRQVKNLIQRWRSSGKL